MYQQSEGLLYVLGFVSDRTNGIQLTLSIPSGAASDGTGAVNAEANATITYQPPASEASQLPPCC